MIQIFVRHYLNEEGLQYFDKQWFPYVKDRVSKQVGYVCLEASKDLNDSTCRCIVFQFSDQASLDVWVAHDNHQAVIYDLNQYRVKPWHYFLDKSGEAAPPDSLSDCSEVPLAK